MCPQTRQNADPVAERLAPLLLDPVPRLCLAAHLCGHCSTREGATDAVVERRADEPSDRTHRGDRRMAVREAQSPVGSLQRGEGRRARTASDLLGDLPQHADHARHRGARPHPLQAGQDPGLVLHRARQRGRGRRRRDGDGAERRRHAAAPRHGRARHARRRAVARSSRSYMGREDGPDARPRRRTSTWPIASSGCIAMVTPPAGDAPGRGRHGARLPDPRASSASPSAGSARAPPRAATPTRR